MGSMLGVGDRAPVPEKAAENAGPVRQEAEGRPTLSLEEAMDQAKRAEKSEKIAEPQMPTEDYIE